MNRTTLAWTATVVILATSLWLRVWHRGDYIPGWDVLGAAQGLYLVSTRTPAEIWRWYVANVWYIGMYWNLYGAPCVIVPGALAALWPWQYWNHAVVLGLSLVVLWLAATAFRLGRAGWVAPLAWATSSTLVSQSLAGLPYLTCTVPYALAIWTVLRLRARPIATALLAGVVYLVAFQGQELGRTSWIVFLAAAVGMSASRSTRLVWALAGSAFALDTIRHPTINTASLSAANSVGVGDVLAALQGTADRLFVHPWIDLPTLVAAGLISVVLVRRDRWLWRLLFAFQLALAVLLALKRDVTGVWPRRFLLVDATALFVVVAAFAEWRARGKGRRGAALVAVLFAGALWQVADTIAFVRQLRPEIGWAFTLPFAHSTVDYQSTFEDADWTRRMLAEIAAGKKLILAYNFTSYNENATNPSGIPERLYLSLGPERFARTVYFFGAGGRWDLLRARPLTEIEEFVASIDDPASFVGWYAVHPLDAPQHVAEMQALFDALERRFMLVWESLPDRPYELRRFTLAPRADALLTAAARARGHRESFTAKSGWAHEPQRMPDSIRTHKRVCCVAPINKPNNHVTPGLISYANAGSQTISS